MVDTNIGRATPNGERIDTKYAEKPDKQSLVSTGLGWSWAHFGFATDFRGLRTDAHGLFSVPYLCIIGVNPW
jgi:hypothetical protein